MADDTLPSEILVALAKITADQPGGAEDDELISLLLTNHAIENPRYRVGGYPRISDFRGDDGISDIGVVRQAKDILLFTTERNAQVVEWFVDNDFSASNKRKKRPDYDRLFAKLKAGTLGGLVAWDFERLYRQPREVEDLIDVAEERDILVATEQENIDLSTSAGKDRARDLVRGAAKYSDEISRRQKRKVKSRAAVGLWHGGAVPFGYSQDLTKKGHLNINESEAGTIRLAVKLLLAGDSLSKVVRVLDQKGLRNRKGKPWSRTALRAMLLRPTLAGIRRHEPRIMHSSKPDPRGQALEVKGMWKPIISEADHAALRALLLLEIRRTTPLGGGHARKFLGVGYVQCGRCRTRVIGKTGQSRGNPYTYYICPQCYVRRDARRVDEFIAGTVIPRLSVSNVLAVNDADVAVLELDLETIERKREALATAWASNTLKDREWEAARKALDLQEAATRARLAALSVPQRTEAKDPAVLRQVWDKGGLEDRRDMIAQSGVTFRLDPVGRGARGPSAVGMSVVLA